MAEVRMHEGIVEEMLSIQEMQYAQEVQQLSEVHVQTNPIIRNEERTVKKKTGYSFFIRLLFVFCQLGVWTNHQCRKVVY
jgi:hypothetical protein